MVCVIKHIPGSDDQHISWKSSDDEDDDNEQTGSNNDGDDFVHPKLSTFDEEERHEEKMDVEEEGYDQRFHTTFHFESTNDDVTQGDSVEEENLDKERQMKRKKCMMDIFHDMIKKTMEVFMDDFSVFGNSFGTCLSHLDKMLKQFEDTNLCLNWEKTHFMVKEGIIPGHKISKNGIKVDKAKVNVIAKLPHPTTVKDNRTMAQMLQAPIEGYEDAIVVPQINANNFELKQTLINLDALDSAAGGNFLDKIPRECLSIIESKSKVRYSRSKVIEVRANANAPPPPSSSHLNSFDLQQIAASLEDKLDIRMNRFEKSLNDMKNSFITPTAPLKAVAEVCVTCGINHSYNQCPLTQGGNDFPVFHDNIQQFQTAAVGNFIQNRQNVSNQMRPPGFHQPNNQNNQNRFQGNNFNQN
nr:reverse transcriptase domain-containing protein [Tanacetum cinerariifolium]